MFIIFKLLNYNNTVKMKLNFIYIITILFFSYKFNVLNYTLAKI